MLAYENLLLSQKQSIVNGLYCIRCVSQIINTMQTTYFRFPLPLATI